MALRSIRLSWVAIAVVSAFAAPVQAEGVPTATALMTLVQAGKVDLDEPVNDYLGDDRLSSCVGNPKDITVRSVANHTSGLPASDQWFYGDEMGKVPDFSQTIHRYGFAFTAPGERYRYSNLGYGVLGHLIGKVSGASYGEFMQQALLLRSA